MSFIYVSTVYSNCHVKHNEERFYNYLNPEELITLVQTSSESTINETISSCPFLTKAISEMVVKVNGESILIGIFRPSAVTNVSRESLMGWVDNYSTAMGFIVPASKGLLKFIICNSDCKPSVIPVDIIISALIASKWDVFNQPQRRGDKINLHLCIDKRSAFDVRGFPFTRN
ncbi:PREDICTED: fatty acyl-CoA reductase 1-like isoform X2 [Dinoponera quadriceps]|uniref:Fatty acyl-CoA reductase n=1 Tax=Dinoponera quadriceps TaxID=609295 RepID=A0A6P3XE25_DINQU|nr:PREDICTED: fatty acyl-CoA reductase 1-like isoform X2 [Dinoponera quadriceps]XP_014476722.1 PREDICTED: fatty acyl-CoA reductase 1-like isoform X2 [Dinoponera quadriceps]